MNKELAIDWIMVALDNMILDEKKTLLYLQSTNQLEYDQSKEDLGNELIIIDQVKEYIKKNLK